MGLGAKATSPLAPYNLGIVYFEQHQPEMAIAEYQAAIQLYSKYAESHISLSLVITNSAT